MEVEWRDYGLDRCMDEMLAAGGEFPRPVIERLVHHHDTLQELFEALAGRIDPLPVRAPAHGRAGAFGPSSGLTERASTK